MNVMEIMGKDLSQIIGTANANLRVIPGPVANVQGFGAIGDGNNDDTAAIQAAINSAYAAGGGTAWIPTGTYKITSTITVKAGVDLVGSGRNSRLISTITSGVAIVVDKANTGAVVEEKQGGVLRDFLLTKQTIDKTATGIWMKTCTRCVIERVYIRGFQKGIDTSGESWSSTIANCYLRNNTYGIYLYGTDVNYGDPRVSGLPLVFSGLNGGHIVGNEIQGNTYGIYYEAHTDPNVFHNHGVSIRSNVIEGNTKWGIRVAYSNGACEINGNYFEANATDATLSSVNGTSIVANINLAAVDIMLESTAAPASSTGTNTASVVVIANESVSNNCFLACSNISSLTVMGNRTGGTVVYFHVPSTVGFNQAQNVTVESNQAFGEVSNGIPQYGTVQNSTFRAEYQPVKFKQYLFAESAVELFGYDMIASVSPQADLTPISDIRTYIGVVTNKTGYPEAYGSIMGYKNSGNGYSYCWQMFHGINAKTAWHRYALNATTWSPWAPIGALEQFGNTASRPTGIPVGEIRRYFDTTLDKPIWWNGANWKDATGTIV